MGKGSVLRTGAGIVYDNDGNGMAAQFASGGSPGLASSAAQVVNTNFTNGLRYDGSSNFTPLSPPSGGSFPHTPPVIQGGFTSFTAVSGDLKAPYEISSERHLRPAAAPAYEHRSGLRRPVGDRALVQQDFGQPLENFVIGIWQFFYSGGAGNGQSLLLRVTPAQAQSTSGLILIRLRFQNVIPGLANHYIPGSASANLFYDAHAQYAGSWK